MAETRTQRVLRVLLSYTPELEQAMLDVLNSRDVNMTRGFMLELLGKWVGRRREGVTDDDIYRRFVRAQIRTNKSSGTIDNILTVARLVLGSDGGTLVLENTGTAAYIIRVEGISVSESVAQVLVKNILRATSGGVQAVIGYTNGSPATQARWGVTNWGTSNWSKARDRMF